MKTLVLCVGLLIAVAADAGIGGRAALTGRHEMGSYAGAPIVICEYAGPGTRFEILSENGRCAPYLDVQ